jgi:hypothetical protein
MARHLFDEGELPLFADTYANGVVSRDLPILVNYTEFSFNLGQLFIIALRVWVAPKTRRWT